MPKERIEELTRQAVISLNKIWDDGGWTNNAIVQELERNGESASLSTIQRLRAKDSASKSYNYNLTVKPILRVFAGISEEPLKVSEAENTQELQLATLNNTLLMREADISLLETKLAATEERNRSLSKQLEEQTAAEQRKIAHLQKQLGEQSTVLRDRRDFMDRLDAEKKQLRRTIALLVTVVVILSLLIFAAFIVDRANSDIGFFWVDGIVSRVFSQSEASAGIPGVCGTFI